MAVQREKRGRKGRGDREREEVLAAPFSLARPLPRCADTGKSKNRKMTRKIISSHSSLKLKALSLYWRGPLFSNRLSDSRLRAPCLFDFLFLELFLSADDEEKKQKNSKLKSNLSPFPFRSRRHPRRSRRRRVSDGRHGPDDVPGDGRGDFEARLGLRVRATFFFFFDVSERGGRKREEEKLTFPLQLFQKHNNNKKQCRLRHQEDVQGSRRQGLLPGRFCDRPEADHQLGEQTR